jgi:hypothetical protein
LLKVAVTFFALSMVMMAVPAPVAAPLQPRKVEPGAGVAVNVIVVPAA